MYFHALGITRAKNFGVSLWCVYKVILLHVWRDQPCALVFFHWTVTLKYICKMDLFFASVKKPLIYLLTMNFGVAFCVSVISGDIVSVWGVESSYELHWAVLLLVLNTGPSECVADNTLIVVGLYWCNSTRCETQSAALLLVPDIHSKVMLYVASSNPHLLTLFAFFPFRNLASGLWSFFTIISAPCR